jgi:phosphatidylserine/phosphatidylglycerophosphate/cardiolipin synthase-like enzyme
MTETMPNTLAAAFLREGGQPAEQVAGWLAQFISAATSSLEIAIYDCHLDGQAAAIVRAALQDRVKAGVAVRLVYDASRAKPQTPSEFEGGGADFAPNDTNERVEELGLPDALTRGVHGYPGLMHHKFMVRDRQAVWTGSLNWSNDAMTRMENIILMIDSSRLAAYFQRAFEPLWTRDDLEDSGKFPTEPVELIYDGRPALTDVDFSPGQGEQINEWVAARIERAQRRIVVCSMLINSSRVLNAFLRQMDRGDVEISGVYDKTQMDGVLRQWEQENGRLQWKIDAVKRLIDYGRLIGKESAPYEASASHNFMHNKTLVVDDAVVTGSYNLSHAAESNAENMLAIDNEALAERAVAYIAQLRDRFQQDYGTVRT